VVIGVREVHRFIEGYVPELGTGGGEGDHLQAARPLDVRDSLEVTEARHRGSLQRGPERPGGMLEVAPDPAVDLQAPELNVASAVSELPERDPHLHEPPVVDDAGRKVPYRVPRRVAETGSPGSPARIRAAADLDDLVALNAR